MERKIKVGIVGLGGIAQKVYLPILTNEKAWTLIGAYSPTRSKREAICQANRITSYDSLAALAGEIDAAFVHTSTPTHYEVVSFLLKEGIDVYVDKPLAATVEEAERLVELSEKTGRKLMVGFNRRFAPFYQKARELAGDAAAWVRIEKHRMNGILPDHFALTLLDDYIHLVDLARWIGGGEVKLVGGHIATGEKTELLHTKHAYLSEKNLHLETGMHRSAGTGRESVEWVCHNRVIRVIDLEQMEVELDGQTTVHRPGSWDTILKRRGFIDAVDHFIQSILGDSQPAVDGKEGLRTQQLLEELIKSGRF
ncbi:Gfo/Idh/MocA family protein [Brevibacillus migulae]|uniref:Gfo/Idh/MocA family protein n=1 Tax=Brevibacillus migulae TaxID=1644114 RepID=UPI00106DE807|nr:Gfo/Idh/MocA family oxidoreductase [Brevibacillus migulae]